MGSHICMSKVSLALAVTMNSETLEVKLINSVSSDDGAFASSSQLPKLRLTPSLDLRLLVP